MQRNITRSYLHILSKDELIKPKNNKDNQGNLEILLEKKPTPELCKFFYKEVGKDFFWKDRLRWSDEQWLDYINNNYFRFYILKYKNNFAGYYELLYDPSTVSLEIPYFGIFKEFYGKGIGGYLLTDAILTSFNQQVNKVWVHTCTLDHPNALKNYLARGMKIFKTENIFFNPEEF